ncbi:SIMPL domain-containing protein [Rurimicrobium arvi]|uniref:SIMPL domain-containing protein n=1 Tax=Rurimicrobium arvi TaxID=2049916 RepID=A0ABP8MHS8_9BACT
MKHLLTMVLLCTGTLTFAQTRTVEQLEPPYVEVTGTAEKEVVPDEIYISIRLQEEYNKNKVTIEEQEAKLKSSLQSLGIDLSNLYLSDANADYVKVRWAKKDVLTAKDYTLKVSSAAAVGQVFPELDRLQIKDASIARVDYSKMDSLKKAIKIEAIKAAKDKADYLLRAVGEQVGKPLIVKENDYYPGVMLANVVMNKRESEPNSDGMTRSEDSSEIQFQKMKIQASMLVRFSIK